MSFELSRRKDTVPAQNNLALSRIGSYHFGGCLFLIFHLFQGPLTIPYKLPSPLSVSDQMYEA